MANEFARFQSIGLSCVGRDAGTLSEIDAELKTVCLAIDINPVISKETSIVCCCSWTELVDVLNTLILNREDS